MINIELRARPASASPTVRPADAGPATTAAATSVPLALVLLPLRLFLAAGWLRAGVEKLISPAWWRGATLHRFLAAQDRVALPFFRPVMRSVLAPLAIEVAAVVVVTQILLGVALFSGRHFRVALWAGVVLNTTFVLAGKVNPSAFYLAMEAVLLYALAAGAIGSQPTVVSRRTVVAAAAWFGAAIAMAPFIRTLKPAEVIDDPAIMLTFLAVVMGTTTLLRWAEHHELRLDDERRPSLRSWLLLDSAGTAEPEPAVVLDAAVPIAPWAPPFGMQPVTPDRRDFAAFAPPYLAETDLR